MAKALNPRDSAGAYSTPHIVPNLWQGECDCIVGPFSGREVAEYFAGNVVDFGQFESFTRKVFAKRDAWYVEVQVAPDVTSS